MQSACRLIINTLAPYLALGFGPSGKSLLRMKLQRQWRYWWHFLNLAELQNFHRGKEFDGKWLHKKGSLTWLTLAGSCYFSFSFSCLDFFFFFLHFSTLPLQSFVVLAQVEFFSPPKGLCGLENVTRSSTDKAAGSKLGTVASWVPTI